MMDIILSRFSTYYYRYRTFLTFLLTGVGTTLIYLSVFAFSWYILHINHIASVTIAYIASASYQFFANRKITFKVKGKNFIPEILRYVGLLIINYFISLLIMQFALWVANSALLGLILTALTTPLTGYLMFKYWIFKKSAMINQSI